MAIRGDAGSLLLVQGRTGPAVGFIWEPVKIGPGFEWIDHDTIRILEGGLAGKILGVRTELMANNAGCYLFDQQRQIGSVSIERNPPGKGIILWDAQVLAPYRQNGLAAIMTWIIFRELLLSQTVATFRIRMVRSVKAGANGTELQNIGMGVIAVRLGFTPELNLGRTIRGDNITGIEALPAVNGNPPALKITLRTDPFVLAAFVLSPDTMKPTQDFRTYLEIKNNYFTIHEWAKNGLLVINGNYLLRTPQIHHFVNRMAVDEAEAIIFRNKIRGL
ncbi:MAG: hypothetical protein ACP5JB_03485 [candidate division WOR-3 bacterium]|jgi:hypothetical protein